MIPNLQTPAEVPAGRTLTIPGVGEVTVVQDATGGEVLQIGGPNGRDLVVPAHVARGVESRRQAEMRALVARTLAADGRRALDRLRQAELDARPHRSKASRRRLARSTR